MNMTTVDPKTEFAPAWRDLLKQAVTEPGVVSAAYSRFWQYSLGNQLMALAQCSQRGIEPGPIASFLAWKDLGRYVRKGEHAITLCMPISGKRRETARDEATGETTETETCYTRFVFRRNWFVLAQTEGAEFKPTPIPGWDRDKALGELQITVGRFDSLDGNCQGYAVKRQISVSPVASHPERTTFHELAHVVLGHTFEGSLSDGAAERTPKNLRELEAEAVAMLCCSALGLPGAAESRGYIQAWFSGDQVPERSAQKVFHAADQILKAGISPATNSRGASEGARLAA